MVGTVPQFQQCGRVVTYRHWMYERLIDSFEVNRGHPASLLYSRDIQSIHQPNW